MTANTIADRSTQLWGVDALGPKTFDVHVATKGIKEPRLYAITPEIEEHAEHEQTVLDHWVAFRVAPYFVGRIVNGQSLDLDTDTARDEYIAPQYRAEREHYVVESESILEKSIPAMNERIDDYVERANNLDASVISAQQEITDGNRSPKLRLDIASWSTQSKTFRKEARNLTTDISNSVLNARIKDTMAYRIDDLLDDSSIDELTAKTEDILAMSRKIAIEQVINMFKSERATLMGGGVNGDDEGEAIRGYDKKIELLEIELSALQEAEDVLKPVPAQAVIGQSTAEVPEAQPHPSVVRELRKKLFGSFSTRAAAVYGAMFH